MNFAVDNEVRTINKLRLRMNSILFICHGNICRSPMAEYIMKHLVRERGLTIAGEEGVAEADFRIDSAAVSYEETGNDIYPPAKRTLRTHGIPFGSHSAHRVTADEASEYDLLIIMDSSNRRLLSRIIRREDMAKVHGMMEYAGKPHRDVSDPWYTGDFETTYKDILAGCKGLLDFLVQS